MRYLLGVTALWVLIAGCMTTNPESVAEPAETATVIDAPEPEPESTPEPEPEPEREAVAPDPPTVTVGCPDDFSFPDGQGARVDFGVTTTSGSASLVTWQMDYGDGASYGAESAAAAARDVYWHNYDHPGTYTASITVTAADGETATASCSFLFSWDPPITAAPMPDMPPSGGGGGLFGGNWIGCHYDGVPMWGDVYVADYSYQADIGVHLVDYAYQADIGVHLVDYAYQANSCGAWHIVDYSYQADFHVYLVDYSYQADIGVHLVDYSYQAGR